MKKSINYWSFSGKDIYEAMDLAKKAGFEGIELALMAEGDLTPDSTDEQLAKIRAYADKIGIKLPSLASGLCWGASFTSDDPAERAEFLSAEPWTYRNDRRRRRIAAQSGTYRPSRIPSAQPRRQRGCHDP